MTKENEIKLTDDEVAKAKLMAETVKEALGLDSIKSDLSEMKTDMGSKADKQIFKVFVGADVEKEVGDLEPEEKVKAFSRALAFGDEASIKALSEGSNPDGGYTVPQDFYKSLVSEITEEAIMRKNVKVIKMNTNVFTMSKKEGQVKATWTLENATKSTTTMHFSQPTITAFKLAAIIYLSDELIDDSAFDLTDVIIKDFADEIASMEDEAIVNGSGTAQPTGFFQAGTIKTVKYTGSIDFDSIINLIYALPAKYRKGNKAKFFINTDDIKNLSNIKDTPGRYIWAEPVSAGQPATIKGFAVVEQSDVPVGKILFGDTMTAYWLGDRQNITVKITQDSETTFTQDKTGIRVVERIGGNVIIPNTVRILQSA